jgi:3-oxoadipate enol-lactonase
MKTVRAGHYEIAYVEEGAGFPVLLIHGLAGDHTAWEPQLAAWKSRYRVVAPDNRGAGASTQSDERITTRDMANDMLALMDALGIERAHVVGRSMGGAIAQQIALMAPARVQSIVMCASFAKLDAFGARVLSNMREVLEITGSWAVHARHSVRNFVSPEFFDANPERVAEIERLIGGERRLPACYIRQNHACLEHDTLAQLGQVRCPTLVMSGGKDPICPPVCARWMVERIPGAESEVFADSSHFFLMEETQRFMQVMDRWLETRSP